MCEQISLRVCLSPPTSHHIELCVLTNLFVCVSLSTHIELYVHRVMRANKSLCVSLSLFISQRTVCATESLSPHYQSLSLLVMATPRCVLAGLSLSLPAPMNHVKIFKGWPPQVALRNWYNCGTKHFQLTMVVRWKRKTQLD